MVGQPSSEEQKESKTRGRITDSIQRQNFQKHILRTPAFPVFRSLYLSIWRSGSVTGWSACLPACPNKVIVVSCLGNLNYAISHHSPDTTAIRVSAIGTIPSTFFIPRPSFLTGPGVPLKQEFNCEDV